MYTFNNNTILLKKNGVNFLVNSNVNEIKKNMKEVEYDIITINTKLP